MTVEQATKNLINATNDYGHGSIQFKAALRAYNRAVKKAASK